jgi:tRNA A37 methylthiotransferase MiaB
MDDRVPAKEIKRRAAELRDLGTANRARFADRFVGSHLKVLLEGPHRRGGLQGYSRNYLKVLTAAPSSMTNCEVEVEVNRSLEGVELVGEIVGPKSAGEREHAQGRA